MKKINFNYTSISKNKLYYKKYPIFDKLERDIIYTFSGKSALSLLLRYYRANNRLENKASQVLITHWIGYWVYMIMHKHCFPTTTFNPKVRGVVIYHQWGFPQDIEYIINFCKEKKLFCIEDCAHSFFGFHKGKRLGTFADSAIFSLAKFFPCVVGGAIYTKNDHLKKFINKTFQEDETELAKKGFNQRKRFDQNPNKQNRIKQEQYYAIYDMLLKCPQYSLSAVKGQLYHNKALQLRRNNYNLYREAFNNYDYMEILKKDILPWAIPLFFKKSVCEKIVKNLRDMKVESGIYHFDINKNMLKPDFRECLAVPCHQGMTANDTLRIIKTIKRHI